MSVENSGTQLAVISTEHTLATVSTDGTFVLYVNTENMVLIDELEVRVKLKVLTGSTSQEFLIATYAHVQGQPIKASIPVNSPFEVIFTLKQIAGTGRNFEWSVNKL